MPLAELGAFSRRQAKLLACRFSGFTVLSCSPPPWGSPLRGQLKLSKFAPGEFVAWYRPARAVHRVRTAANIE
jgi:hypothetical protein